MHRQYRHRNYVSSNQMTPEQETKLNQLLEWKVSLESAERIPLEIDNAFRARFLTSPVVKTSNKGNDSEDQAVNEGGVATYSVLKEPDDFLEVVVDTVTYYIPVYNALT